MITDYPKGMENKIMFLSVIFSTKCKAISVQEKILISQFRTISNAPVSLCQIYC